MTTPYYADGLVTLHHGDCREVTEWLDGDVLVTDPPYGIAHSSNGGRTGYAPSWAGTVVANDGDTRVRDHVIEKWGDRPALVFGSWKRPRPTSARAVLIWDKGLAAGMGDLSIPWKLNWEEIYVLGSGFVGARDSGVLTGYTQVSWESRGKAHPHQKPENLMEHLIRKCLGVIADPFAGSGSTLIAAKNLGRRAIGVEIDERYCEIAAKRLGQDTLFGEASA